MEVDQGTAFGTWPDPTSRLLYHDIMPVALNGVPTDGYVVDLGGGNGLLKQWVPQAVTVDVDADKQPDVLLDITDSNALRAYLAGTQPDLVVLRYVLHYLPHGAVRELLACLAQYRLLVIQFANDDLPAKQANSVNEVKHFRIVNATTELVLSAGHRVADLKRLDYWVDAEFYRNRLAHPDPTGHYEQLLMYHLTPEA